MTFDTLKAEHLVKSYRQRRVVNDVSFHVKPGEIVGLLGPNGAGKTTSFNMVLGEVACDSGSIWLGSEDLTHLPMHQRARRGVGYLPQEPSIFRRLTVRQNFLAVLELQKSLTKAQRLASCEKWLEEFGLKHVGDTMGESLSGGERRRAEIARSLIAGPQYMLFDEPFAGVDPINVSELQKEIARLRERGLGILITDHNVRDTLSICDRAYILAQGQILEEGTPQQLASSSRAKSAYLGENFQLG